MKTRITTGDAQHRVGTTSRMIGTTATEGSILIGASYRATVTLDKDGLDGNLAAREPA